MHRGAHSNNTSPANKKRSSDTHKPGKKAKMAANAVWQFTEVFNPLLPDDKDSRNRPNIIGKLPTAVKEAAENFLFIKALPGSYVNKQGRGTLPMIRDSISKRFVNGAQGTVDDLWPKCAIFAGYLIVERQLLYNPVKEKPLPKDEFDRIFGPESLFNQMFQAMHSKEIVTIRKLSSFRTLVAAPPSETIVEEQSVSSEERIKELETANQILNDVVSEQNSIISDALQLLAKVSNENTELLQQNANLDYQISQLSSMLQIPRYTLQTSYLVEHPPMHPAEIPTAEVISYQSLRNVDSAANNTGSSRLASANKLSISNLMAESMRNVLNPPMPTHQKMQYHEEESQNSGCLRPTLSSSESEGE